MIRCLSVVGKVSVRNLRQWHINFLNACSQGLGVGQVTGEGEVELSIAEQDWWR